MPVRALRLAAANTADRSAFCPKTINARKGVKTDSVKLSTQCRQCEVQKLSMPVRALRHKASVLRTHRLHCVQKLSMPVRALRLAIEPE